MDLSLGEYAIAAAAVLVGATVQGSIGFGVNLLSAPVIAIVHPSALPGAIVILALPLSTATALRERHAIERESLEWLAAGAVPGTLIGLGIVRAVSTDTLAVIVGGIAVLGVAVSLVVREIVVNRTSATLTGLASGTMGAAAGVGGPPVGLLFQRHGGPIVRSTLGAFFMFTGVLTAIGLVAVGKVHRDQLLFAAALAPPMATGLWASRHFHGLVDRGWMRPAILALSGTAGLVAIVHGLT
ncbi:MAG: sulfite exporter TauE/SafE family protein [Acidimicrobiia bacterium]